MAYGDAMPAGATEHLEVVDIARGRELLRSGRAKALRESLHLSRGDIARQLGVDPSTYGRWEEALRTPRAEQAVEVAHLFRQLSEAA
jgi:DNA-binding XRE family transcriptional regulator